MSHLNLPEILAQWKILQVFALVHILSPSRPSSFCFTIFLGLPRATEIFHARFPVSVKCLRPLAEDLSSSDRHRNTLHAQGKNLRYVWAYTPSKSTLTVRVREKKPRTHNRECLISVYPTITVET